MKKQSVVNGLSRTIHKAGFQLKKHSPEILVVAGVVGVVTSTVLACRATTKASKVLEKTKQDTERYHELVEDETVDYTEEDLQNDIKISYVKTGVEIVKLYAPAVALGALSLTGIVASHHILRKRNIALAAAYTVVDKSFKEYRGRVIERFGAELDKELKYNIQKKEVEVVEVDEDGKEKTVKKTVSTISQPFYSQYARVFDDGCTGWTKNSEFNLNFLRQQQNWANELLQSRGYLFLNEVYESLGIPKTQAGQAVGWVIDGNGDNYVDFGIYDIYNEKARDFVNGYEKTIILDFNVDGSILEHFEE